MLKRSNLTPTSDALKRGKYRSFGGGSGEATTPKAKLRSQKSESPMDRNLMNIIREMGGGDKASPQKNPGTPTSPRSQTFAKSDDHSEAGDSLRKQGSKRLRAMARRGYSEDCDVSHSMKRRGILRSTKTENHSPDRPNSLDVTSMPSETDRLLCLDNSSDDCLTRRVPPLRDVPLRDIPSRDEASRDVPTRDIKSRDDQRTDHHDSLPKFPQIPQTTNNNDENIELRTAPC